MANAVTVARIFLVPVFFYLSYKPSRASAIAAFVVFVVASASDSLDGYLARRNGNVSRTGQFLDPLADKLLIGTALIVLVDTRAFPFWAAALIAFREVAVQILRTQIVRGGGNLPASAGAKAKTVLQIAMVSWWLLPWEGINLAHWVLLAAVIVTTMTSGYEYFRRAMRPQEVAG